MLPWELQKRQILPVNQNFSSVYYSIALLACELQPFSCHDLVNDILLVTNCPTKLCSATFNLYTPPPHPLMKYIEIFLTFRKMTS